MRVNIVIDNADYGKFSDLQLCYADNGVNRQVPLSFLGYERVFDFLTDFTSVKFDFFLVSAIVYGVDNLLSRAIYSNDGWTRDIEVEFPVNNLVIWSGKEEKLKQILDFLTGDNWQISFREIEDVDLFQPRTNRRKIPRYENSTIASVSLFSGGLDSLIGVINELEKLINDDRILLVSHFDSKSPGPNGDQRILLGHLMTQYPNKIYWVQSKLALSRKDADGNRVIIENNYRSRSLFFIGLGCYLSPINELIIPENGTISINYPLTPSRVSSLSTRTTHPYVLKNTQELLTELGLVTLIHNPYNYKTKGEMFVECANQTFLQNIYQDSVSCGKRGRRQFHFDNPNEKHNCGRCMPCIYRRAALNKAGLDDENHYGNFITKVSSLGNNDLPALFSYLKRNIPLEKMKRDLLVNGNIDIDSLKDYAEMVLRSKAEVLKLFNDKGNRFVKSELGIR
ncbi:Qat anti-phage system QueC-like protein QatC [Flavobacterium sasangense]|uniref:Qat anti-phage system QueC-like protein QatC n=1 Tax=Flavobacterium sasangense TaxID=503361 RepID=UPI00068CB4E8|nr:Qat anti-phage system QueC-like protein QatC [Flavobacterium sasangense]